MVCDKNFFLNSYFTLVATWLLNSIRGHVNICVWVIILIICVLVLTILIVDTNYSILKFLLSLHNDFWAIWPFKWDLLIFKICTVSRITMRLTNNSLWFFIICDFFVNSCELRAHLTVLFLVHSKTERHCWLLFIWDWEWAI